MRRVVYSMMVSLDGFIATPDGGLEWATIDEELHTFANDQARETGAFLYGRGLYETMAAYWPTADADTSAPEYMLDFARIWKDTPKIVFSKTLDKVEWNSRLVRSDVGEEVAKLKAQPGNDLSVGGAHLAAALLERDLIDEYQPIVHPVILGAGTPFLPLSHKTINLRLLETRTFTSGVIYLRYEAHRGRGDE
jgi:dihydrofolate reductase